MRLFDESDEEIFFLLT